MKCFCLGRLTADPVLKEVNDTKVCEFTLAENYYRKDKDGNKVNEPHFFNCVAWDTGAEIIAKNFKKGERMFIEAVAKQEKWEDVDKNKKSRIVFRVTEFHTVDYTKKEENE